MGTKEFLDKIFPSNMSVTPAEGFHYALQFDCDALGSTEGETFLNNISNLKRHLLGGPLDRAFSALLEGNSVNTPLMVLPYRYNEGMFINSTASKVTVVFQVDFADETDKAVAKVFLQEFVEAQRTVRTAPPCILY